MMTDAIVLISIERLFTENIFYQYGQGSTLGWPSNSFSSSGLRNAAVAMTAGRAHTYERSHAA